MKMSKKVSCIVNYSLLDAFCRNSWKRSRKTRTRLKSARKMRRLTSTQSRYVPIYLALQQNEVHSLAWFKVIVFFFFFFQDYEFQILTYKALQDPIASPLKKPKMECASDNIIQEVGLSHTTWGEQRWYGRPGCGVYESARLLSALW